MSNSKFVKMFSGRKRESEVWKHFTYDQQSRKSRCNVVVEKERHCGMLIAGKYPTILKSHLCRKHEQVAAIVKEQELEINYNSMAHISVVRFYVQKAWHHHHHHHAPVQAQRMR